MKKFRKVISFVLIGLILACVITMLVFLLMSLMRAFFITLSVLGMLFVLSYAFLRSVKRSKETNDEIHAPEEPEKLTDNPEGPLSAEDENLSEETVKTKE